MRLDIAVATSYSLDLNAMLLAPLSFALFDSVASDPGSADPVRLLEAARRYGERITVYCQAGGIAVPSSTYSPVLAFVEKCVVQVAPPQGVFHPKVWALRFIDPDGAHLHRVLVLSRNLTFDRSWDTMLRLDEDRDGDSAILAGPLVDFLAAIPGIALGDPRSELVDELCASLVTARLSVPEPFTEGEFLPRGFSQGGYPFPVTAARVLAISPFLDRGAVSTLERVARDRVLVSRPETLDRLGSDPFSHWDIQTLQRSAEVHPEDEETERVSGDTSCELTPPEGLHAKTFIFDIGRGAEVITGSGNLTAAAWHQNVEFGVRLRGPKRTCGIDATLKGTGDAPGLECLLTEYRPTDAQGVDDPSEATQLLLERAHTELVAARPTVTISVRDGDQVGVDLRTDVPWQDPGRTVISLLTVPAQERPWSGDDPMASWSAISRSNITPYVVIETTAGAGDAQATRRCIVKAALAGDVGEDRSSDVLAQILETKDDVLRYLILLLGDPAYDSWAARLGGYGERDFSAPAGYGVDDYALFEPLVRAAGRDAIALERIAALIDDLRRLSTREDLTPDGFHELWAAVWEVHQETIR